MSSPCQSTFGSSCFKGIGLDPDIFHDEVTVCPLDLLNALRNTTDLIGSDTLSTECEKWSENIAKRPVKQNFLIDPFYPRSAQLSIVMKVELEAPVSRIISRALKQWLSNEDDAHRQTDSDGNHMVNR